MVHSGIRYVPDYEKPRSLEALFKAQHEKPIQQFAENLPSAKDLPDDVGCTVCADLLENTTAMLFSTAILTDGEFRSTSTPPQTGELDISMSPPEKLLGSRKK
jgi:hypothetical protein